MRRGEGSEHQAQPRGAHSGLLLCPRRGNPSGCHPVHRCVDRVLKGRDVAMQSMSIANGLVKRHRQMLLLQHRFRSANFVLETAIGKQESLSPRIDDWRMVSRLAGLPSRSGSLREPSGSDAHDLPRHRRSTGRKPHEIASGGRGQSPGVLAIPQGCVMPAIEHRVHQPQESPARSHRRS